MFIFQVNAVKEKESQVVSQFRADCEQAIKSVSQGQPKREAIAGLDKKYNDALLALPKKGKAENVAMLDGIYSSAILNMRPAGAQENRFTTTIGTTFDKAIETLRTSFFQLDNFKNLDDLGSLEQVKDSILKQVSAIKALISDGDTSDHKYANQFKVEMAIISSSLTSYYKDCINGSGELQSDNLESKVNKLAKTVYYMNELERRVNVFTQAGQIVKGTLSLASGPITAQSFIDIGISSISDANLAKINALADGSSMFFNSGAVEYTVKRDGALLSVLRDSQMSPEEKTEIRALKDKITDNKESLDLVASMRYGKDGNGFSAACTALGIAPASMKGKSAGTQYDEIIGRMLDSYQKLSEYSSRAAIAYNQSYSALLYSTMPVTPGNYLTNILKEPGAGYNTTRDAFDPFARLSLFRTINEGGIPSNIMDGQLAIMVDSAKNMPVSTAGILFSSDSFFQALGTLPDDQLRQLVFNQAAILLSNMYVNTTNDRDASRGYANAALLMSKFGKLNASGNLVTEMETSNFYGLERGHIGIKTPWQGIDFERRNDMTGFETFANATLRPFSLFGWAIQGSQVQPRSQMQISNMNSLFQQRLQERERYANAMPSAEMLRYNYTPNYLGKQASYGLIIGKMNDEYNAILAKEISNKGASRASITGLGSGTSMGGKTTNLDISGTREGMKPGQSARVEGFYHERDVKGSTYSPGQYSEFDEGKETRQFYEAQANQMQILGTNVWQGLMNYDKNYSITKNDAAGQPVTIGGLKDEQMSANANAYLNSTFPGATDGTTIAFFNQAKRENAPVATSATDATKESTNRYDLDVFMKKGETWVRVISKDRSRELLTSTAAGETTVRDAVDLYFTQLYSEIANKTVTDAAVEVGKQNYEWDKNNTGIGKDNRLGVMVILQPGIRMAAGGASTTTGDKAGILGMETKTDVVHGGFYSFSNLDLPPAVSATQVPSVGFNSYYIPSYELDEKQPKETADKSYIASATWLAISNWRASVFGGWKAQGGTLFGEDIKTGNANISSFMSFDSDNKLASGIMSVGGKTKNVGLFGIGEAAGRAYALQTYAPDQKDSQKEAGAVSTFKVGTTGTLTIACNLRPEQWGSQKIDELTLRNIVQNSQSIVDYLDTIPAETLLDPKKREPVMRELRDRVIQTTTQAVSVNPTYDLYSRWLTNVSVGYHDKGQDWVISASTTEDKRTFISGISNFSNKVAVIGGFRVGGPSSKPETYKWLSGAKFKPSQNTAFSLYVAETQDKRMVANVDAASRRLGDAALAGGKDYFRASLSLGDENISGIFNYTDIGTKKGKISGYEVGSRLRLGTSAFLTAAYAHTTMPGMDASLLSNALYATASQYNLFPEKMAINSFKGDLMFKLADNVDLTVTAQMSKMKGRNNPYDFYGGIGFNWRP